METLTLSRLSDILKSKSSEDNSDSSKTWKRLLASSMLAMSDVLFVCLSLTIALAIRQITTSEQFVYYDYFIVSGISLPIFVLAFYLRGLYPGYGMDVVEELRSIVIATTVVFSLLALVSFLSGGLVTYSRMIFAFAWIICVIAIPLGRTVTKCYLSKRSWWGTPVMLIGAGNAGGKVLESLVKNRTNGLIPVVALDDDFEKWGYLHGVPVVGGLHLIKELKEKLSIDTAIIAMPKAPLSLQQEIVNKYNHVFGKIYVIPDMHGVSNLWIHSSQFDRSLGITFSNRLTHDKVAQFKKRMLDIILGSLLFLLSLPLFILISIIIVIDSRGKVLLRQERLGQNWNKFGMYKFRTMHIDAEERLAHILATDEKSREEFNKYHKLLKDPRLTRIGAFLRKYSLDEIPQFINVIKGDMSLVGPRAFMGGWEIEKIREYSPLTITGKPGLTGLWQVFRDKDTLFEERCFLDQYYLTNWSAFLDIYIIARTISVVVLGRNL